MPSPVVNLLSILKRRPERMHLVDLVTQEDLEAQFNPGELGEHVAVMYTRLGVLGMSHQPMQYQYTGNHEFEFEMFFRVYDDRGNRMDDMDNARRFLLSLTVPPRGATSVLGGAPPRVLFIWPNIASLTSVITDLKINHTLFNIDGRQLHSSAKVKLEEIRDVRIFSDEIRRTGTLRRGGPSNLSTGNSGGR
jgi:hypothetical protein